MKDITIYINEAKSKLAKISDFNHYKFGEGTKCLLDLDKSDKIWFVSFVREEIIQINGFDEFAKNGGYNDWHCWEIQGTHFSKETYDYLKKSILDAYNNSESTKNYIKNDDGDLSIRYFRINLRKKTKKDGFCPVDGRFIHKDDKYSMYGVYVLEKEIIDNFMKAYPNYKLYK